MIIDRIEGLVEEEKILVRPNKKDSLISLLFAVLLGTNAVGVMIGLRAWGDQ